MYEVPLREPDQIDCAYLKIWFDRVPVATGKSLENRKLSKYYLDSGFSTISEHKFGKFGKSNSVGSQLLAEKFKFDSQIGSNSKLLTEIVEIDAGKFSCGLINVDYWKQVATYLRDCFFLNKGLKLEDLEFRKMDFGTQKIISNSELDKNSKHYHAYHKFDFILQYQSEIHFDYGTKTNENYPVKNVRIRVHGNNANLKIYHLEELFSIMYNKARIHKIPFSKIAAAG